VVAPNAPTSPTGLVVTGDGFTMRLAGLNAQGQPLGLSYDGGALILEQDRMARVEGTGFLSNSEVRLYVFSTPRYIGSVTTDASGNFSGEVPIPMDLAVGRHTLQANGYSKEINVRSLSLGVVVKADRAPRTRVAKATVTFLPLSAQLSPQTKDQLRALLKGRKGAAVRTLAVGYVQPTSVMANDEALSTARAKAVKSYLRSLGLTGPVAARGDGIARETGAAGRKVVVSIRYTK
jgi:outer membrane protein OmpA-like peptidoglycan-associated protein